MRGGWRGQRRRRALGFSFRVQLYRAGGLNMHDAWALKPAFLRRLQPSRPPPPRATYANSRPPPRRYRFRHLERHSQGHTLPADTRETRNCVRVNFFSDFSSFSLFPYPRPHPSSSFAFFFRLIFCPPSIFLCVSVLLFNSVPRRFLIARAYERRGENARWLPGRWRMEGGGFIFWCRGILGECVEKGI